MGKDANGDFICAFRFRCGLTLVILEDFGAVKVKMHGMSALIICSNTCHLVGPMMM